MLPPAAGSIMGHLPIWKFRSPGNIIPELHVHIKDNTAVVMQRWLAVLTAYHSSTYSVTPLYLAISYTIEKHRLTFYLQIRLNSFLQKARRITDQMRLGSSVSNSNKTTNFGVGSLLIIRPYWPRALHSLCAIGGGESAPQLKRHLGVSD